MNSAAATKPRQVAQEIDASKPGKALSPIQEVRSQLDSMEPQFKMALPAHMPPERFVRVLMTAIGANQDLLSKCSRSSLFAAAMKCAQDGLLPDGREAALIPFNGVVQYLPMVAGILKKIRNSGQLSTIVARVVYAGDKFRNWIDDEGEHIEYEASDDQDRSVVRRVFAMAKLKDGSIEVEVLQPADIEKIRNVSRAKNNGPWVSWWDQMAQKSAIRRLSKRLPISTDLDDVIRRDDNLYDMKGAREEAQIANGGRPQSLAGKFDMLAQMPGRENAPVVERQPAADEIEHDPETGEVSDQAAKDQDAGAKPAPVVDEESDNTGDGQQTPRELLIHDLRGAIMRGDSALKLLNDLSAEQAVLLTEDDKKGLKEAWKSFSKKDEGR